MNYYKITTLGCKFVSFQIVAGSGLGDECPTIVGPNTLARLGIGILFSSQWAATLQPQDAYIYMLLSRVYVLGRVLHCLIGIENEHVKSYGFNQTA